MSLSLKSLRFGSLSNKEREDFFLSEDDDDNFNFKYVPADQFKNIVKDVRRRRIKMDEERVWASFIKQQGTEGPSYELSNGNPAMRDVKQFLCESMKEVDRELKRLEEDALPERNKRTCENVNADLKQKSQRQQVQRIADKSPKKGPIMKDSGTGSTNILLTIPEEENLLSVYQSSSDSKQRCKKTIKKSCSDHMVSTKDQSKRLLRALDDSEYNSSPELSPDQVSDSDKEERIYVRPEPVAAHRVLAIQKKVSEVLDEISFRLNKIPLPDGDKDLHRRQQRVMEFAIRFSRNYLYDLGRQIADIQRHIRAISPNSRPKPSRRGIALHMQAIEQKLVTAHQMLLQALSAYCKHIPSAVLRGHPGKLKEILQMVVDTKDICTKIHLTTDYFGSGDAEVQPLGKETQRRCNSILSKLQLGSDNESQLVSHTTRSTLAAAAAPASLYSKKRTNCRQFSNRLSMYNVDTHLSKNCSNRRSIRCGQKEQRHSANGSKILSDNRSSVPEQPNPSPVTQKSSKLMIRNRMTKVRLPSREDDIRTVMDTMPTDSDAGSSIERSEKYNNVVEMKRKSRPCQKPLPKMRLSREMKKSNKNDTVIDDEELTRKVTMITDEHLSSLVPVIADLMSLVTNKQSNFEIRPVSSASMETLLEFLQKYQSPNNSNVKPVPNGEFDTYQLPRATNFEQIHRNSDSGARNMQLICLSSEDQVGEVPKYNDVSCQADYEKLNRTSNCLSEMSTTVETKKSAIQDKGAIRLVAPATADTLITEYQCKYQSSSRSSPMYLSSTQNKPWDVVAWIADRLVDELIAEISKELQMDDVIKKLFDLEFQEF